MAASTNTRGEPELELGAAFPAADRDQWLAAVRGVLLKGRPDATDDDFSAAFARTLVTRTEDGFDVDPLYTSADAPPERPAPGSFPYTRSTHPEPRPWEIRQRVWVDVDESSAVTELESGATGVLVELGDTADADVLDRTLDGVLLDLATISLSTPAADDGTAAAIALLDLWDRRAIDASVRTGTLGVDPIAAWARSGGTTDLAAARSVTAALVTRSARDAPAARAVVADATVWHDAGASTAQELAWVVAGAADTVRSLVDAGTDLDTAFATIEFRLAATADQFATITKFRAARLLWARVADVSGAGDTAKMFQHADTSRAMLTRYDPWVNALRSTVACFSAAVGGADAVTVSPHDVLIEPGGSTLGRRIARNTQTILQLESNLARVVDLAGGSWYVEARTDELAAAAWAELQRVEAAGGLVAAVEQGLIHDALATTNAERGRRIATRTESLTGLSEFPDISETPPPAAAAHSATVADAVFEPFTLRRDAAEFERQRGRADAAERETGSRPVVFLATLGGLAASTPRATFAKNLFEAGGIRTVQGEPAEFDPTVTTIACLCSSDAVYAEEGSAAAAELRRAGATKVFVAGRKLDLDGVDEEVGMGSDVLDVLTRTLDELGVPA